MIDEGGTKWRALEHAHIEIGGQNADEVFNLGAAILDNLVLIAEDEPYIAESLKFLMERAGLTAMLATDGAQTIDLLFEHKPALVILDVMMQFHNGFEILKIMKSDDQLKDIRVLVLTAKGQEVDRKIALELGADKFVTKPFSNKELVADVKELLKRDSPIPGEPS